VKLFRREQVEGRTKVGRAKSHGKQKAKSRKKSKKERAKKDKKRVGVSSAPTPQTPFAAAEM